MKATNNIVKLLCGTEQQGTALLVNQEHAITVRHCLKDFYRKRTSSIILVVVIDGISKEISALPAENKPVVVRTKPRENRNILIFSRFLLAPCLSALMISWFLYFLIIVNIIVPGIYDWNMKKGKFAKQMNA